MGAKSFEVLNNLVVAIVVWVGRILILSSSSFSLSHISLSLPNILMFSLICTWIEFIGVVFLSSRGEVVILSISTSWAMLSTFEERLSNLFNFSSTLLLKAFWVVIKSLSMLSSSEVEFLGASISVVVPIVVGWEQSRIVATKITPI